jgi:hypothetical protein
MAALKGYWQVTAGIIPRDIMPEHTRVLQYLDSDYEADQQVTDPTKLKFTQLRDEAYEYAAGLNDPGRLNWVTVEWMWL